MMTVTGDWLDELVKSLVVVVLAGLVLVVFARFGARFVRRVEERSSTHGARAKTLWVVMRRVVTIAVVVTSALVLFGVWGFSLAPFVAVGTLVAAALGFGAQSFVKDVISGFFILLENQFAVGDVVRIADTSGTVEDVQLRVTVLRDFEGNVHYVPNGEIKVTSNLTSKSAQPVIDIGVAYSTDVDRALAVIGDEMVRMASDPEWSDRILEEPEVVGVQDLADSAVVLRVRLLTVADERWSVRREALRRLKNRFDAEGIEIPFPQITIHRGD